MPCHGSIGKTVNIALSAGSGKKWKKSCDEKVSRNTPNTKIRSLNGKTIRPNTVVAPLNKMALVRFSTRPAIHPYSTTAKIHLEIWDNSRHDKYTNSFSHNRPNFRNAGYWHLPDLQAVLGAGQVQPPAVFLRDDPGGLAV